MHLSQITISHEKYPTQQYYPFNLATFLHTKSIRFDSSVSFFVGENGTGKSTLLKAISRKCGIYIWEGMARRRFDVNPYEKDLYQAVNVHWTNGAVPGSFFASEIFRDFARILDEWATSNPGQLEYFGGKSLLTQSHGQSLMSFFKARYKIKGLYLMDEPETALSPKTQLELLALLQEMANLGHAQFIIATHSPILMACPGAQIFSFDETPITQITYKETDHYQVYREFMKNPG